MVPLIFLIPLSVYMTRALWKWLKTLPDDRAHGWRASLGLLSFGLATASLLLVCYTGLRSRAYGGFPYYSPFLLNLLRAGVGLGTSGFLLGLPAKGSLRWPAVISSFVTAALWVIVATSE